MVCLAGSELPQFVSFTPVQTSECVAVIGFSRFDTFLDSTETGFRVVGSSLKKRSADFGMRTIQNRSQAVKKRPETDELHFLLFSNKLPGGTKMSKFTNYRSGTKDQ